MGIALALAAAAAWGAGDFFGGLASRRIPALGVALRTHAGGLLAVLAVQLLVVRAAPADGAALIWGAVAGLAGGAGLVLFYAALARGTMSMVAPVSGVTAAVAPVVVGVLGGERPSPVAASGLALAVAAIALVGGGGEPPGAGRRRPRLLAAGRRPGLAREAIMAMAAGAGFGLFAVFIERAGDDSGLWPLATGRVATVTGFTLLTLVAGAGQRVRPDRATWRLLAAAALLDAGANAFYLYAAGRGLLSIVGAIVALYPATTVILARTVLHERLAPSQRLGLAAAAVAVTLVASG